MPATTSQELLFLQLTKSSLYPAKAKYSSAIISIKSDILGGYSLCVKDSIYIMIKLLQQEELCIYQFRWKFRSTVGHSIPDINCRSVLSLPQ